MKRWYFALVLVGTCLLLTGCAGQNPLLKTPGANGIAGFWSGLWHGLICPIAFVIGLFNHHVSIFEVHNSGSWYSFGFILGAGAWGVLRGHGRRGD